jgi:hypothetical protein
LPQRAAAVRAAVLTDKALARTLPLQMLQMKKGKGTTLPELREEFAVRDCLRARPCDKQC